MERQHARRAARAGKSIGMVFLCGWLLVAQRLPEMPLGYHGDSRGAMTIFMNSIANGIQDVIANLSSLIDMLSAAAGGFADVAAAMNAILHVIAMLTGA
jgi:hypothetical protein